MNIAASDIGRAGQSPPQNELTSLVDRIDTLGLMIFDASGRLSFVNSWLRNRWRGPPLIPGQAWDDLLGPLCSSRFVNAIRICREAGRSARLSHYLNPKLLPLTHPRDPDRALPQTVSVRAGPKGWGGRMMMIEVRDMSIEVDRENALRAKIEELANANRILELFVTAASHDLRGPLLRVRSGFEMAFEDIEDANLELPEEAMEAFGWIDDSLRTVTQLLDNLMLYCRLGGSSEPPQPIATRKIIEDVLKINEAPAGFEVAINGPLPALHASEAELTLILRNLIVNALTHHDKPAGRVELTGGSGDGECWIAVTDDGPGVPAEQRGEIVKPMVRLTNKGGSGLGLAMIARTIQARSGRLEIGDRDDGRRGAVFRVVLPAPDPAGC